MPQYSRLNWNGDQRLQQAHDGLVAGLKKAAEHVLQVSRTRVPLEEGTLERSGVASVDGEMRTAAVSYDTVYAVRQHEELAWRHAEGRTAKYLEEPLVEEARTVQEIIAAEIRRRLRSEG